MNKLPRRLSYVPALAYALAAQGTFAAEESTEPPPAEAEIAAPAPEGVPTLEMSTDFTSPGLEFGTYRPMGQVESRAIRVAPFNIRAAVQGGIGYDDNIALSNVNKVGSLFASVAPSVAVGLEGALQRYYLVYRGNYGSYASTAQDNYADHNISVSAFNSWTPRVRSTVSYEYLNARLLRGIATTAGVAPGRSMLHMLRAGISYGADGAPGRLEGGIGRISRRYTSDAIATTADNDIVDVNGSFQYRAAPKTRATFSVGRSDIQHPGNVSLDNAENRYAAGVIWEALATTTTRAAVGITTKDFASPIRSDVSAPTFEAAINWRPLGYTSVDLSARRFLSESYTVGSNFVVNTVASGSWNHEWPGRIRSSVNYTYGRIQQEGLNRTDTYQNIGGRVSYPLRRSLRVGAELRRYARDSDVDVADYTRNIILLTVETAL